MAKRRRKKSKAVRQRNRSLVIIMLVFSLVVLGSVRLFTTNFNQVTATQNVNQEEGSQAHQRFINKIVPTAQKMQSSYGVLPSITIAQAILESDWGTSTLASKYNNLFGVKANDSNNVTLSTKEYQNGRYETVKAKFQVYDSWDASIEAHDRLLAYGTNWNSNQYIDVISANNYREAAIGLQTDGYATDPSYTQKLVSIIQKYNLDQYDQ